MVWDALRERARRQDPTAGGTAAVLDIGGGTGGFAVRVAELGHQVTVVDPSPDALAILGRRADESGVADRVTGLQGDLATPARPGRRTAASTWCSATASWRSSTTPQPRCGALAAVLRPGGTLSLLVNQRHAAVVARAMAGHFDQARTLLESAARAARDTAPVAGSPPRRSPRCSTSAGFDAATMHAVRVFVDLVPSSLVDLEPGAAAGRWSSWSRRSPTGPSTSPSPPRSTPWPRRR